VGLGMVMSRVRLCQLRFGSGFRRCMLLAH
jgi:hypothetical protein